MGSKLVSRRQTSPIFYNAKTLERVTKKIITLVMVVAWILKISTGS